MAGVAVKARLESVITQVHFEDGAQVKRGDLLFTLDSRQIEAEIKKKGEGDFDALYNSGDTWVVE